jgi:hypothetical protein
LSGFTLTTNRGPVSAPTIACAADKTVQCGDAWTFDAPAAVDGCSGAGLPAYVLSIVTNGRCPQVITQTWAVTNSCDTQYVTCSQQVTIVNLTPPVLTCAPNKVASFGSTWAFDLPIASDPCAGGSLPVTVLGTVSNNLGSSIQLFTRTWLATNTCNNNFTAGSQTVTVTCSNCPVWAVIANAYGLAGDLDGDGLVDQTEINAVLANYWASNPGLYMTNPISLGGGFFQFALTNFTGWNFTMLASTNLVDWASLPGPAYPVYQFYDAEAASNAPVRVYRLRWP